MPGEVGVENGLGAGLPSSYYATIMPKMNLHKSMKYRQLHILLKTTPLRNVCNNYTNANLTPSSVTTHPVYSSSCTIIASTQSNSPVVMRVSQ